MKGFATVRSGTAGTFDPIILLKVEVGDESAEMNMSPKTARRIGLDLIAAATAAMTDAAVRRLAKRTGIDGDGLIDAIREVTSETFEAEG